MRRRTAHLLFGAIAAACAATAITQGLQLREAKRINTAIAQARVFAVDTEAPANGPGSRSTEGRRHVRIADYIQVPQARLAQALILAKAGKFAPALRTYKSLLDAGDEVRLAALYDLGNLNMREALKNGPGEAQRALPLIELAKQSYRDALRSNPADWDARYNLERALWLSPEYDDPVMTQSAAPVHTEHATSTLQGAKIDLP
jgi:mxaK protein